MPGIAHGLAEPYLQNALAGGCVVALLGAFVGYFVVARGAAFATHALSQIGFAGAAGAGLVGISPLAGLIAFALGGAFLLSGLARRSRASDVTTALLLVTALGTGALFLALQRNYASNAFRLLFGTIVGIDRAQVLATAVVALFALVALATIARPLAYATAARDAAAGSGLRIAAIELTFLTIVALSCAITVPIVGALLVFSLTIGPAAAAARLSASPPTIVALSAAFGASAVVGGVILAYETDWPIGFFIASITTAEYVGARLARRSSA
ncbi:MAG: metal ABC transporter permease [Vulcanimicrobiaceae bacterium]